MIPASKKTGRKQPNMICGVVKGQGLPLPMKGQEGDDVGPYSPLKGVQECISSKEIKCAYRVRHEIGQEKDKPS